jgi:two-component system, OmpR family, sensor histidine kinase KdpD
VSENRTRGRLKVYLGYAAGVGKTYQMLEDAQDLRRKGVDVVIGYFEPHGRKETIEKTQGLEFIPRKIVEYAGARFEEMDTAAILARKPAVCVVDEFAHTNVPGAEHAKRWEDVQTLLDAGISVLTTMNVQHLESLNDQVWRVTGVRVRETLPDWVIDEADDVVFIDLTARALRHRLERGVVYAPEKARQALENFFQEPNLAALREMALRYAAHEVEGKLATAPAALEDRPAEVSAAASHERVLLCLTGNPSSAMLIRRGKRVADYLQAKCMAVHILPPSRRSGVPQADREAVERHLSFARNLRIETHVLEHVDVSQAIAEFARANGVTQIFMGRSAPQPWWKSFGETVVQRVVRLSRDMEITIVAQRRR